MDFVGEASRILMAVRHEAPRVHCLTNDAAQAFTADVLLAAGAIPSLTLADDELPGFLSSASAVLINLGTLDARRLKAIEVIVPLLHEQKLPWVMDPVFVERSKSRLALAAMLLGHGPDVVRGNRAECGALADLAPDGAAGQPSVIAMTDASDLVFNAERAIEINNGHAYMSQATAIGCALSALVAACLAVERDALLAASTAVLAWGVAGEIAGVRAGGPGTFRPLLIDALFGLDEAALREQAQITEREQ
jgi:hydroxyethylthiazole kinase